MKVPKRSSPLQAGQVWVTRHPKTRTASRRIVAVIDARVCYSTGGEILRWCRRSQFRHWIRAYAAKATRTARKRSLALKALRISGASLPKQRDLASPAVNEARA